MNKDTLPNAAEASSNDLHLDVTAPGTIADRRSMGFFWEDGPKPDPIPGASPMVAFAQTFLEEMTRRAEKVDPLKLDGPITKDEWWSARASQPPIVDRWFYEDVGCFVAPGGTGKTTLLLFQVIHIVLGKPLFGHEVFHSGAVVILTAEDSRETLVARLRLMCMQMNLTEEEIQTVREEVVITDVSGRGIKLTTVEKDVVMPSRQLDRLVVEVGVLKPSLLIVDPLVSFGVGESRVNDAEQGMIDAARRVRNTAKCGVLYVHHTGKENARNRTTDQYSGRGGSALADGSRMVHVLQRLSPDDWTEATGDQLEGDDVGFVLARPKMTWCAPQPDIYLKRQGYCFERFDAVDATDGAGAVTKANADKVWQFLKDEYLKGAKHTGRTLEAAKLVPQKATRDALARLLADGRIAAETMSGGGRGGAHHYLRPIELPLTT